MSSYAGTSNYAGTLALLRLALRRDRVMLSLWVVLLALLAGVSAGATLDLYPTVASRVQAADVINGTTSLVALYGRIYDPTSLGAVATIKLVGFGAVLVSIMSIMVVIRHTRADEEAGRTELLGATMVGRYAGLSSALLTALTANLVLFVLTTATLLISGLPMDGSLAFTLVWFSCGMVFAAVAALFAQVTASARAATGLSSAALGLAYVIRAIADTSPSDGPRWLTWISPIGWGQQLRPFAGNHFWTLGLSTGFCAVAVLGACMVQDRRDLGAGLTADRPGPSHAADRFKSSAALAWRLERTSFAGWLAAFVVLGAVCGSIASNIGSLLNNDQTRKMIARMAGHDTVSEQQLSDLFLAAEFSIMALIVSGFGIQVVTRMRAEESQLHAEMMLATAITRTRWVASYLVIAILGTAALVLAAGFAAGVALGMRDGRGLSEGGRLAVAAAASLPAVWLVVALTLVLYAWRSDFAVAGWGLLVGSLVLVELGAMLRLDQWLMDISPFTHVPHLPGSPVQVASVEWLLVVTAVVTVAAFARFRRRDIG
jgi:ABC-2 type transport system permease protein